MKKSIQTEVAELVAENKTDRSIAKVLRNRLDKGTKNKKQLIDLGKEMGYSYSWRNHRDTLIEDLTQLFLEFANEVRQQNRCHA